MRNSGSVRISRAIRTMFVAVATLASFSAWSQTSGAPDALLQSAKQSTLFEAQVPAAQLQARGLARLEVGDAVYLDLQRYVEQSRLTAQPDLAPLLRPAVQRDFLTAKPVYDETILKLQDRIVVERELTVPIKTGACARSDAPKAITRLCFKKKSGKVPSAVAQDLTKLRAKLAAAAPAREVKPGVTAADALKMDDTALLGMLLNTDARTIRRTSVIPLRTSKGLAKANKASLTNFAAQLPPKQKLVQAKRPEQLMAKIPMDQIEVVGQVADGKLKRVDGPVKRALPMKKAQQIKPAKGGVLEAVAASNAPTTYADPIKMGDRYFLTGFTIGREFSDEFEYTFADETWLTDRYYVRLDYSLSLGFGMRVPFSFSSRILPVTGQTDDRRLVEIGVKPINVDRNGLPAYPKVGLDRGKYFSGDEFVLELKAEAGLYISIPGPNVDVGTPSIGFDKSANFDPVIGGDRSHIGDIVLAPARLTGLQIDAGVGGAGIDLGLSAELHDGKIGLDVRGWSNTELLDGSGGRFEFNNRQVKTFTMKPVDPDENFGFVVGHPTYAAAVGIAPFVQPWTYVDVGVWDNRWEMDPLTIDALTVSLDFDLDAHEGTRPAHGIVVRPTSQ